jgi:hypothetical protein
MILQFRILSLDSKGTCRIEGLYDDLPSAERRLQEFVACFPSCRFQIVPNV